MTSEQTHQITQAIKGRAKQWKVRVGIGAIVSLVFFSLTGIAFAILWLAAYILATLVELKMQPDGRLAQKLGKHYVSASLAMVACNNLLFGAFGAMEIASGKMEGLTCAGLLAGGSIINAVLLSPRCRPVLIAAILPHVFYALLLPIGAITLHGDPLLALQMLVAISLMITACSVASGRLAQTFIALEAAQQQAEDANRAKSEFLATMSHEIRTPLNGVLGMTQAIAADTLSDRQRERLDVISQSGKALLTILDDVLDLAKIEARKLEIEAADFDLTTLVEQSQETFRAIAESKGLSLTTRIDPHAIGSWRGDRTRLRQVIGNLISNAVKFTIEGRVCLTVDTTDDGLRFVVEDTGPGVAPDQLPSLFEKFVQADASTTRRYGGTGLGLAICCELAKLMGGSVTADHVTPHGLRFTFDVPAEKVDTAETPAVLKAREPYEVVQDGSALRVLAAEDHPVNRQVLTLLLAQAGITPHIVVNGADAVAAWRAGAPDGPWDMILMDVQMPVMDGPAAARAIRAEERTSRRSRVPIIALTANVMTHQIEDYRQSGMDGFVAKPIQVETLLAAIETALVEQTSSEPAVRAA